MFRKNRLGMGLCSAVALLGVASVASATDPYAALISAVDFTSVTTDVIAVAALVVVVLVALRAVRFIFQIIRR
jgi:hypothetical protein